MESLLTNIEWVPVIVSTVVAFMVGWAWYSPKLFVKGWLEGIGEPVVKYEMWMPMFPQLGATLFFAAAMNIAINTDQLPLIVLFTIVLAGFIKANGLYSGKTVYAIGVETMYIFVMAAVLWGVNMIL